jgi:hypothetical protein
MWGKPLQEQDHLQELRGIDGTGFAAGMSAFGRALFFCLIHTEGIPISLNGSGLFRRCLVL